MSNLYENAYNRFKVKFMFLSKDQSNVINENKKYNWFRLSDSVQTKTLRYQRFTHIVYICSIIYGPPHFGDSLIKVIFQKYIDIWLTDDKFGFDVVLKTRCISNIR